MVVEIYNWFVAMISDPFTAYLLIVALMAVESSFIPFPSEIVVLRLPTSPWRKGI